MAYIGRGTDKLSNIEKLDTITFDGSSSYTLQKNSVNFTPSSANNLQVSIDGVVQAGNFTVSGSTIDFGVAIPSTSTCDFIFHYGTGLITTPADGTVSLAKLSATGTKDATTFLRGDNTFAEAGGGIEMADQWRLTATTNNSTDADVTSNWERNDTSGYSSIGTGLTESSGIFSFPSTGIYYIIFTARVQMGASDTSANVDFKITTDNSSYNIVSQTGQGNGSASSVVNSSSNFFVFDVTNISTHKFKFSTASFSSGTYLSGNTDRQRTGFIVIRLGDT